jgi:hypothetical protein
MKADRNRDVGDADAFRRAAMAARIVADEIVLQQQPGSTEDALRAFALVLERMAELAETESPS